MKLIRYYWIGLIAGLFIASPLLFIPPVSYEIIPECVELECIN